MLANVNVLCGCLERAHTHEPLFTLPFERQRDFAVYDVGEDTVWVPANRPEEILAPQDAIVLSARKGAIRIQHFDREAVMLLDDVDEVLVEEGDRLCAGDVIGKSQQVRLRTYYGVEEFANLSDLSMIRVIEHNVVKDMSEIEEYDVVHSALGTDARFARRTDVNQRPCVWESHVADESASSSESDDEEEEATAETGEQP